MRNSCHSTAWLNNHNTSLAPWVHLLLRSHIHHLLVGNLHKIYNNKSIIIYLYNNTFRDFRKLQGLAVGVLGEQGWHNGESTCPPPVWPTFEPWRRCYMWVEFVVGSLPCVRDFCPGTPFSPLLKRKSSA